MPALSNIANPGDLQLQVEDANVDCMNDDYQETLLSLLPPGPWWNLKRDGVLHNLFKGLAREYVRVTKGVRTLVRESSPTTVVYTIDDWEDDLGLPGACDDPPTTLEGRRAAIIAKLQRKDSYGRDHILSIATSLGYANPTIRLEGAPFRCNGGCTQSLRGFEGYWLSFFTLLVTSNPDTDSVLECLVEENIMVNEIVAFEYS